MPLIKPFVGKKEIVTIEDTGSKTPLGGNIVKVSFDDGTQEILTEKILNLIRTEAEVDETELRRLRVTPIAQEVLILMRESNTKVSEVEFLFQIIATSIDENFTKATNQLWNVEFAGDRTFLQADEILKNNGDTSNTTKNTS